MKKITLIVIVLVLLSILVGCETTQIEPKTITQYETWLGDVSRFVDKEAGVVCWLSAVYGGYAISCLPIKDTMLH